MKKSWFYIIDYGKHEVFNPVNYEKTKVFFADENEIIILAKKTRTPFSFKINIYELCQNGECRERNDIVEKI